MKVNSILGKGRPVVSFEFFPPKTDEGVSNLMETIGALKDLSPSYVSLTYGAGGSTREKTVRLVSVIKHEVGLEAIAHLTCVGHSRAELESILNELRDAGIDNVLALRGDPPKGQSEFRPAPDGLRYASELVELIRRRFSFCVGVAGYPEKHPEAPSMEIDLAHLKKKVEAGGDFIVTQLFFNNRDYFSFVERLRSMGVTVPVIAGIMPITDVDQIKRFTDLCRAKIPEALSARLEKVKHDREAVVNVGIEHATKQCEELIRGGAPGIHFYTLNKSRSTLEIFSRLKRGGIV